MNNSDQGQQVDKPLNYKPNWQYISPLNGSICRQSLEVHKKGCVAPAVYTHCSQSKLLCLQLLLDRKLCLLAGVFYESQYREWVYVQCVCECLQWLSYYICQGGNVSLLLAVCLCAYAGIHKSYRINLNKIWWNDRKWAKKDFFGSFFFCLVWFYAVNIMVWFLLFIQLLFCCIALSLCYNPVFRLL